MAGGAAGARYTPLSTLSEEGNEVLRRALDPARSFASAEEFCAALRQLDGQPLRPPDSHPGGTSPPPARALPPPLPPAKKKSPLGLIVGIVAGLIVLGMGGYFLIPRTPPPPALGQEETPPDDNKPPTPRDPAQEEKERQAQLEKERQEALAAEKKKEEEAQAAEETKMRAEAEKKALAVKQRQELLKTRLASAQALEEKGEWAPSVRAWLAVAREFPESGVGKNHLETLLNHLRDRPSPISFEEFTAMREPITEAAQIDILSAMLLIGDSLRKTEPETAFKWYTAASEKGDAVAFTQLGFMQEMGVGDSKPDFVKAVQHFQTAADKGDIGGKFALGRCYLTGRGLPAKDEKRGAELAREAAEAGDTRAMNLLGDCYTHGTGVKTDFAEAFRLFTRASDRGNLKALGNLGVLYMTGRGVPAANPKKAAELFEKGARAGDSACMYNYAQCLDEGIGTGRNSLQAQAWYRKAAEAGDDRAADWCRKHNIPFTRN